jgi:cytochrome P450
MDSQLETLRLYPPLVHISRSTQFPQRIQTATQNIRIPGGAKVYINNPGLHTNPETWGEDVLEFRPSRWLNEDKPTEENVITALRGTYSPWSGGPRICPGQKMSQVEFVAVISTLFRSATVEPVLFDGESTADAQKRLLAVTKDSQPKLTLNINRPKDIVLKWVNRMPVVGN